MIIYQQIYKNMFGSQLAQTFLAKIARALLGRNPAGSAWVGYDFGSGARGTLF